MGRGSIMVAEGTSLRIKERLEPNEEPSWEQSGYMILFEKS